MPLQVGRLDRRIKIIERAQTANAMGEPSLVETTRYNNVPCRIMSIRATERFANDRDMATKVNTFRIRYLSGIKATDLVEYENEKYNIRGISPMGTRQREWIDILAEAFETVGA
jgi:SPP1 family predicted phage head-tail adaptor